MFYIIIIIAILFFVPIPISISFSYTDKKKIFKIYNLKLNIKEIMQKRTKSKAETSKRQKKFSVLELINLFISSRFKPYFNGSIHITYGFDDAALVGITYGILNIIYSFIYQSLNLLFHVKKFNIKVDPFFNKPILDFKLNCIIFISLANVIYIIYKIMFFRHCSSKGKYSFTA